MMVVALFALGSVLPAAETSAAIDLVADAAEDERKEMIARLAIGNYPDRLAAHKIVDEHPGGKIEVAPKEEQDLMKEARKRGVINQFKTPASCSPDW